MNTSGIQPIDKRVLILPDTVSDKVGSIFVPDSHKEKEKFATMKGTLVAIGETAWSEAVADASRNGIQFAKPIPGDRVLYSKYGGVPFTGDDGRDYRIMNDEDVTAFLIGEKTDETQAQTDFVRTLQPHSENGVSHGTR